MSENAEGTISNEAFESEHELVGLPLLVVSRVMPFLLISCEQIVPVVKIGQEVAYDMWTFFFEPVSGLPEGLARPTSRT